MYAKTTWNWVSKQACGVSLSLTISSLSPFLMNSNIVNYLLFRRIGSASITASGSTATQKLKWVRQPSPKGIFFYTLPELLCISTKLIWRFVQAVVCPMQLSPRDNSPPGCYYMCCLVDSFSSKLIECSLISLKGRKPALSSRIPVAFDAFQYLWKLFFIGPVPLNWYRFECVTANTVDKISC